MARTFPFLAASHLDVPAQPNPVVFTVLSFWLKLNGHALTEQTFWGSYTGPVGQLVRLSDVSPGKISSFWIDSVGTGHEAFSNTTVSANVWHHVCCLYTSAGIATVYLDGVAGPTVGPFNLKGTGTIWRAGLRLGGSFPADANMAELAIWQAGTLSPAQIAALAHGAPLLWMFQNSDVRQPWAYWPLLGSFDGGLNMAVGTGGLPKLVTSGTVATANHAPVARLAPAGLGGLS